MAEIAVVIVTHNSARFIAPCLSSLRSAAADLVVVDNGSTDNTRQIIRQYPHVRLIEATANLGYGKAINLGARQTDSKYLILSNADVIYREDTVAGLIAFLKSDPKIGITSPQQTSPSGDWQRSYEDVPGIWSGLKDALGIGSVFRWYRRLCWPRIVDRHAKEVGYLTGAVLALPREAFCQVHGFDESFHFYGEDADLCIRLRDASWKVMFCPSAEVIHHGGGHSTQVDRSDKFGRLLTSSQVTLARKYLSLWQASLYVWLKRIYFQRLALTFRLMRIFAPTSKNEQLSQKIWIMDTHTRLWAEQLGELRHKDSKTGSVSTC
jgi:N-acetylglucosaminyl-diphospho-decaprenol L-rhamnosyltransferase